MSTTPTPTADSTGNEVSLGSNQPGVDNVVSLVAILCGTGPCMTNTWNNVRFVDRTSSADSTDLGPLYRPDSASDDNSSDNKGDSFGESEDHEDHDDTSTLPIAISVPLAVIILVVVVFVYWRKMKKSNRLSNQRDSSYGQLESGGSTPTALVATDSSQRHSVTRYNTVDNQRNNQNHRTSGLSSRRSDAHESGEMVQVYAPQPTVHSPPPLPPDSARLPPVRSNTRRRRTPPPPPPDMSQRQRGNTFSDIPSDDLPPYIDPIEEAMAAGSGTSSAVAATLSSHEQDGSLHEDHRQSPPPYHTLSVPNRAHIRN